MMSEGKPALNFTNSTSTPRGSSLCYHFSGVHFGVDRTPTPYIVNAVLNVPVSFVAAFGNALVLRAFWQTKALHSPSHLLLCNMALVDFGVGLLAQPFFFASLMARASSLSGMFCFTALSYDIVSGSLAGVALFTVTAIFSDKYLSICRQTRYDDMVTQRRTTVLLAIFWLLGPFGGAMWLWHSHVFFAVCSAAICLCLPIIVVTNFKIYGFLKRQQMQVSPEEETQPNTENQTANKRAAMLQNFLVFFLVLFCYLPYLCTFIIIGVSGLTPVRQSVFEFANTLVFIKSSLNPFLMCWGFQDIRVAVFNTARTICRRKLVTVGPNPADPEGQGAAPTCVPSTSCRSHTSTRSEFRPRQEAIAATTANRTTPPETNTTATKTARMTERATATAAAAAAVTALVATAMPIKTDQQNQREQELSSSGSRDKTSAAAIPAQTDQQKEQQQQQQQHISIAAAAVTAQTDQQNQQEQEQEE